MHQPDPNLDKFLCTLSRARGSPALLSHFEANARLYFFPTDPLTYHIRGSKPAIISGLLGTAGGENGEQGLAFGSLSCDSLEPW